MSEYSTKGVIGQNYCLYQIGNPNSQNNDQQFPQIEGMPLGAFK